MRCEPGKPAASRERHYHRGERGERVAQMSFDLDEEGDLTLFDSTTRVKAAFDAGADLDMMLAQLRSAGKLENFDAGAQGRRGAQRENAGSFDAETQGRRGAQSKDDSSANLRAFASNGRQRDGVAAVG